MSRRVENRTTDLWKFLLRFFVCAFLAFFILFSYQKVFISKRRNFHLLFSLFHLSQCFASSPRRMLFRKLRSVSDGIIQQRVARRCRHHHETTDERNYKFQFCFLERAFLSFLSFCCFSSYCCALAPPKAPLGIFI